MSDGTSPRPTEPKTRAADPAETAPPAPSTGEGAVDDSEEGPFTELPVTFGRYILKRLLGAGGMGAVYLAHDNQLDRDVAVKIPNHTYRTKFKDRFLREARVAATFTHPHLCPVYDAGEIGEFCFLTMPYLEGRPLADYISAKPLPVKAVVALVRQLALAMQEAHSKGVVHRDLKPANIIIGPKKQPVIMDFGLAVRTTGPQDQRLTQQGVVMGTPAYMSPEQVNGDVAATGVGSDVYSLGVILYELLVGHVPFRGPYGTLISRILTERPEPPSRQRPEVGASLDSVCLKAMAKRPEDRFHTMTEFAAALDQVLHGKTPQVGPVAEVLALAPDEAKKIEDDYARMFQSAGPPASKPLSRPPIKRKSSILQRRRRRARHRLVVGLSCAAAAISVVGLAVAVYFMAFAGRRDAAAVNAVRTLESSPADPVARATLDDVTARPNRYGADALTAVGRHLVLAGQRDAGSSVLTYLKKGAWKDAAEWERRKPQTAQDLTAAGDAWWAVALTETGKARADLLWHASEQYEQVKAHGAALPAEQDQRFRAVRELPKGISWTALAVRGAEDHGYNNQRVPGGFRAAAACERTTAYGWRAEVATTARGTQLIVRVDGEGYVFVKPAGGAEARYTPAFGNKARAENVLVILVREGAAEIYLNGLAVRRAVDCPVQDGELIRFTVGPVPGHFSEVSSFAYSNIDGVAPLAERLPSVR